MGDLASRLKPWLASEASARPGLVVGVSGPQGSGKTTLCAQLSQALTAEGLRVAVLSLDDLYLTRAERRRLAERVHPLLAVRGPPGTHDVALGLATLDALTRGAGPALLPRFDKALDDRIEPDEAAAPVDLVLFEGWCLGARPQAESALAEPVNALEREADADGRWRAWVNRALAQAYPPLWARLDRLVLLQPPGFSDVLDWRLEQERALRSGLAAEARPSPPGLMSDAEVARFVQHYERITRVMLADPPPADIVVRLDERRHVVAITPLELSRR